MAETLGTYYFQIAPSAEGIGKEMENVLNGATGAGSAISGSLMNVSNMINIAQAGLQVLDSAVDKMVQFGAEAVRTGEAFDSSMSQVAATMGTTVDDISNLRDFALEMGSTTAFSATQAADALNYMALAGYDAETSMEMLPNVLNLAASGGMELASASDMITDSQSALGLTLEQTTVLVDQMAKAASTTNTSVSQLGDAILTVGGTAKNLSGGTNELTQVLGIMADNGIKASEAGTHLRNIMLAMTPTSDAAAEAMEAIGLNAYDAEGNLRPMQDIFVEMQTAMEGMSDLEKQNIITAIFNKTDLASVNALLATTDERWTEVADAIADADGAASEMADTQLDNLAGDITLFESAMEGAKIALSDELTPDLRDFVKFGSDGLSELTSAFKEGGIEGAMEALGGIITEGLNLVLTKLPDAIEAGSTLLINLAQGMVDNAPAIMDALSQAVTLLLESAQTLLPQLLILAGELMRKIATGLSEALPDIIPLITEIAVSMIETFSGIFLENQQVGADLIGALAEGCLNALPILIGVIPTLISTLVQVFIGNITTIMNVGTQLLTALVSDGNLEKIISALVLCIPDIIDALITAFTTAIPLFISTGFDLLTALLGDSILIIANLCGVVVEIIDSILQKIADMIVDFETIGGQIMQGLADGIVNAGDSVVQTAKDVLGKIPQGAKDLFQINSPSKLFEDYGQYIDQGLAIGIEDNADMPEDAMVTMTSDTIASYQPATAEASATAVGQGESGARGDIVIPVYIGQERIDEIIVQANNRVNYMSGGH